MIIIKKPWTYPWKLFHWWTIYNEMPMEKWKLSWAINGWELPMKTSMKLKLGKAMKSFHRFYIECSLVIFHGFFMRCFSDIWTHENSLCSWPMDAFHEYFMVTGHPWKIINATFIGLFMEFSFSATWEIQIHGNSIRFFSSVIFCSFASIRFVFPYCASVNDNCPSWSMQVTSDDLVHLWCFKFPTRLWKCTCMSNTLAIVWCGCPFPIRKKEGVTTPDYTMAIYL